MSPEDPTTWGELIVWAFGWAIIWFIVWTIARQVR